MSRERERRKDFRKGNGSIMSLARELVRVKKQAEDLGLFTNDRELLKCTGCDLVEDVAFDGSLTTYRKNDDCMTDTGLRFEEIRNGEFRCPVCGTLLKAVIL